MSTDPLTLDEGAMINPLLFPAEINIDNWMFNVVKPFIKGRTLEIDSGNDMFISCFLNNELPLHLSNHDPKKCESLYEKYKSNQLIRSVRKINLARESFETAYADALGKFSTVINLNRLGSQTIDKAKLDNSYLLLQEGGYIIFLMPAYTASYSGFEEDADVIRAGNRTYVRRFMGQSFEVRKTQYLNLPALPDGSIGHTGLYVIVIAKRI